MKAMLRKVAITVCGVMLFTGGRAVAEESPYPEDVTAETLAHPAELARLERPGEVFFEEGFEQGDALSRWYDVKAVKENRTRIVLDPKAAHSGRGVLELTTVDRSGKACDAGAKYWFHPGHDVVYLRRYIRFAEDYDQGNLNHVGGSLYAVAGADKWGGMGKAGICPVGDDRFGASFEPWRHWGEYDPPGHMMLYTYWMDMKGDKKTGKYYGNNFTPPEDRRIVPKRGVWVCLEHMIRSNTLGKADGELASWVDGKLYMHVTRFRWRSTDALKIKRISLGLYVHSSRKTNRVWYDDVVLSTGYVGTAP